MLCTCSYWPASKLCRYPVSSEFGNYRAFFSTSTFSIWCNFTWKLLVEHEIFASIIWKWTNMWKIHSHSIARNLTCNFFNLEKWHIREHDHNRIFFVSWNYFNRILWIFSLSLISAIVVVHQSFGVAHNAQLYSCD